MSLKISAAKKHISGNVQLTGSKSESNRALIIQSLCGGIEINNLSEAEDTQTLQRILSELPEMADVGPAGTAMRFLCARLALKTEESKDSYVLTGSARMQERPIGILVDALRKLGAQIEYINNEGFPPLRITPTELQSAEIEIDGSISSQFISALCLVAPMLPDGLKLNFIGEVASRPYLEMTLAIMTHFGADCSFNNNELRISHGNYKEDKFTVEPDWSAASYWYEIAALSESASINLTNLKQNSFQGDAILPWKFENFGVRTVFTSTGITISKEENFDLSSRIELDCERWPDLAQTFACTMAGLGIGGKLTGLKSLRIKETDRISALITELEKFGITARELPDFTLEIEAGKLLQPTTALHTYEDHRMAMAFAPLILKVDSITIDDETVVGKSYPEFWSHLTALNVV